MGTEKMNSVLSLVFSNTGGDFIQTQAEKGAYGRIGQRSEQKYRNPCTLIQFFATIKTRSLGRDFPFF